MPQGHIVFLKIAAMFLVMVAGWWASRRELLPISLARALSGLVVHLTFPALVFTQMISTVSASALRRGWWIPLFALVSIMLAAAVGRVCGRFCRIEPESRRTFTFLVAIPNWVFLPLPIAMGLYGAEGVRFVLLYNFGAQIVLWTFGLWLLQGGSPGISAFKALLGNAGIWATVGGAGLALVWPGAARLGQEPVGAGWWLVGDGVVSALKMIGDLTIPLSLLVTGAQLGAMTGDSFRWRPLAGVTVARLLVAPALTVLLLKAVLMGIGVKLTEAEYFTAVIIVAMPVAISCTMFTERFGGDSRLSAGTIFYSTLLGLVSVPGAVLASRWLY